MERLAEAAKAGDIDTLYALLREDRKLLEAIDEEPFIDSPLHIAAAAGCTHFALEVLRLKPSFGRKLNPDGLSPLLLALRKGHKNTVERIIKYDPDLIRVQGREGITPLHYVAESDDHVNLLAEFLITCPASMNDSTIRGETVVHIAVKNGSLDAVQVLLGWLSRTENEEVLNWKDENGDTVLHLAVSTNTNQTEILELLIGKVKINEKNLQGFTAMDIIDHMKAQGEPGQEKNRSISKTLRWAGAAKGSSVSTFGTLADFLRSRPKKIEESLVGFNVYLRTGLSGDMRNALLVVAVLITTATYQAVLQPPGGFSDGDNNNNNNNVGETDDDVTTTLPEGLFIIFIAVNSIAFAVSLGMIFALLPRRGYNMLLYVCLWFMLVNYVCTGLLTSAEKVSYITLGALQAAFGVYLIIIATRLPKTIKESPWLLRMYSTAYQRREMARSVFLSKYSDQRGL